MDTSFVKGIEDPDRLQLQQQQESAREAVRERLLDYDMVDVIKYRGVNASAGDINTSVYSFLSEELEYLEPDLIFAFGKRAWTTLKEKFDVDPLGDGPVSDSILDVHGHVYRASGIVETDVLPLGHMSGNCRGSQISKAEYQQGIEDGLEEWRLC